MRRVALASLLVALLVPALPATGQEAQRTELDLQLKRKRYVVRPAAETARMVREAIDTAARVGAAQREEELVRETTPYSPERRPDITSDVRQAVQQRNIQRVLGR